MNLPKDAQTRKNHPIVSGVLDYFPDALMAVAGVSKVGNDQHNPGQPLHWAKEKSRDEADALVRHLLERGTIDSDGVRHSAKVAWRALALLQREIEREQGFDFNPATGKWELMSPPHTETEREIIQRVVLEYEAIHGPGTAKENPELRDLIRHSP